MADEEVVLGQFNMKFYRTVSDIDNFDTLSQDSNDEGLQLDPDYVEDRFRVDRKKLELMLQLQCRNDDETAEEFFQRVMDETNTQITWPSKLKIGAKSKKDPHIKVIGRPEDVKAAKDQIMSVLDTKSNRVTLKMDVSHTEHSHVIGKGGNNIKRVMQETGCHIHFPDSNRGSNVQEKSNQVSIAGQPCGVENAREQIRDLLPLVFMFELPTNGSLTAPLDTTSPSIQHIQQTYRVTVSFRQRPKVFTMTVIVRGSVCNGKAVREATLALVEHLTGSIGTSVQVSLQLEIATQHHLFMIGRGGMNIKQIMQRTGATIHFPDPNTVTPQRKGTVYITGSMDSVTHARHQLIGCLPLVLMFDVKDSVEIDQTTVTQLMEQLDVFISVKPKPKQTSKSVIVKSIERNSANMYVARLHLLGLSHYTRHMKPAVDNHASISPLSYMGQNIVSMNTANTLLMMNGHTLTAGPQHIISPTNTASPTHWVAPPPGMYSPVMVMTAPSTYTLANPMDISIHNCPPSHNNNNNNVPHTAVVRVSSPLNKGSPSTSSGASPRDSSCNSPSIDTPITTTSPKRALTRQLQHEIYDTAMSLEQPHFAPIINHKTSPSNSGHTHDLLGLSKPTGSPPLGMGPESPSPAQSLFMLQHRGLQSDLSPEPHPDSPGLTPGRERKNSNSSLFSSHGPFAFDYEHKKLLATKAIQKKPEGESRIPTDFWSGLGFSKSMPDSVIREAFSNSHLKLAADITPLQCNGTDVTDDIDRDPWKHSPTAGKAPINPAPGEYPSPRKKFTECRLSRSSYVDSIMLPTKLSHVTNKSDLAELFSKMGLGKYTDLFQQQEIDLSTFLTLTDYDLKELGISTFGARRKMLLAIADINKRGALFSLTPGSNNPFRDHPPSLSPHISTHTDMGSMNARW